jgi:N-acetylmuramoyl-L-alanine amidase
MRFSWDAGHSLHTLGKQSPDGMHEWEFNNRVVRYGMEFLSHYEGVEQLRVDDPSGQRDVPLSERAMKANAFNSIAHVSCHGNAYGTGWSDAHGIETYVQLPTLKEATALAQKVQANLIAKTGLSNRGVKYTDFQILRDTKMSAILCESGFMTNKREKDLMMADDYCSIVGSAIAEGLAAQYGLKKKTEAPAPQPVPQTKPVPVVQPKHKYVLLPASEKEWRIYPLNKAAKKANALPNKLKPAKANGLEYEILKDRGNWVFEIQTRDFGRVQIFADPSRTSARVVEK